MRRGERPLKETARQPTRRARERAKGFKAWAAQHHKTRLRKRIVNLAKSVVPLLEATPDRDHVRCLAMATGHAEDQFGLSDYWVLGVYHYTEEYPDDWRMRKEPASREIRLYSTGCVVLSQPEDPLQMPVMPDEMDEAELRLAYNGLIGLRQRYDG